MVDYILRLGRRKRKADEISDTLAEQDQKLLKVLNFSDAYNS